MLKGLTGSSNRSHRQKTSDVQNSNTPEALSFNFAVSKLYFSVWYQLFFSFSQRYSKLVHWLSVFLLFLTGTPKLVPIPTRNFPKQNAVGRTFYSMPTVMDLSMELSQQDVEKNNLSKQCHN